MQNPSLLIILSLFTIVAVIGILLWQRKRVNDSQAKRGETPGGIAGPDKT